MSPTIKNLVSAAAGVAALSILLCGSGPLSAGEAAGCVAWRAGSHAGASGYDHVVVLMNHCDGTAVCDVSSDSAPAPVTVSLAPGEGQEVVTFRGAPSRHFTPVVVCAVALAER